MNTYLVATIWK